MFVEHVLQCLKIIEMFRHRAQSSCLVVQTGKKQDSNIFSTKNWKPCHMKFIELKKKLIIKLESSLDMYQWTGR